MTNMTKDPIQKFIMVYYDHGAPLALIITPLLNAYKTSQITVNLLKICTVKS